MNLFSTEENPALAHALEVWQTFKYGPARDVIDATAALAQPIANLPASGISLVAAAEHLEPRPVDDATAQAHVEDGARAANHAGLLFHLDLFGRAFCALGPGVAELYTARDALILELGEPDHVRLRERVALALDSRSRTAVAWYLTTQTDPQTIAEVTAAVRDGFSPDGSTDRVVRADPGEPPWSASQVRDALERLRDARLVKSVGVSSSMKWTAAPFQRVRGDAGPASLGSAFEALAGGATPAAWGARLQLLAARETHLIIEQLGAAGRSARDLGSSAELLKARARAILEGLEALGVARRTRLSNTDHWTRGAYDLEAAMAPIDDLARHVARDISLTPWLNLVDALAVRGRLQVIAAVASAFADDRPGRISVDRIEELTRMDRSAIFTALADLSLLGLIRRTALLEYEAHPRIPALLEASSRAGIGSPSEALGLQVTSTSRGME